MSQNKQSSPAFFRALVMLAFFGGAGYVIVYHTPLLQMARERMAESKRALPEVDYGGGDAPAFGAVAPPQPLPVGSQTARPLSQENSTTSPSGANFSAQQIDYQTSDRSAPSQYTDPNAISEPVPTFSLGDYETIQQQLKSMGATYCLLESGLGTDGTISRFYCKVARAGGSNEFKRFEASDANPAVALRKVAAEVEIWHARYGASR